MDTDKTKKNKQEDKLNYSPDELQAMDNGLAEAFLHTLNDSATHEEQTVVEEFTLFRMKKTPNSIYNENAAREMSQKVWNNLASQLELPDIDKEISPDEIGTATEKDYISYVEKERKSRLRKLNTPTRRTLLNYATAAAAILFIAFFCKIMIIDPVSITKEKNAFIASTKQLYQTGEEATKQIQLPDGTIIILNRETKLRLDNKDFNRQRREVWLEGEAFFEVAKNAEKPFIIHHERMRTIVHGTSFNIKAYKGIGKQIVSVRNGKVEVCEGRRQLAVLTRNNQLTYDEQRDEYETEKSNWESAAGWIKGKIILNKANAQELKLKLKLHFGLELKMTNHVPKEMMLRSSYPGDAKAKDVLEGVCAVYKLRYKMKDGQVTLYK